MVVAVGPPGNALRRARLMGERLLLTPAEAAEMLAIPKSRLLGMVRGGGIGYVRFGPRTVRIPPEELNRVANSRKTDPVVRPVPAGQNRRPPAPATPRAPGRPRRRQTGPPQPVRRDAG